MIEFINVSKWYGSHRVLNDVNGRVERGEVVVICGPSGSGKSTLIRTINRLEPINKGQIIVGETDVNDRKTSVNRLRSGIGFVFQQFNLFPHLSAKDNVALAPITVRGFKKSEAHDRAMELLDKVGLKSKADAFPGQLSGGQQQRVAIARALAMDPPVMLFDEPTSALDPEMVGEVLQVMKRLASDGMTMICVTHEMGFARDVANRVWFIADGEVLESTTPSEFFATPRHPRAQKFVADIRAH
ncbi:amino acid ABC transporter ATP-binding protein [Bradyrhizobium sp. Bra64]|uniref:amino acid ABC transporter ATP-binding protein n=1 Tax=Bradyrhizobium sp. Bra64 TaxID=2926009 RepID=UPI002117B534|nr:amino acid ABC transporter ATP-binding protein [Bradyrhizobium sp. Bra64]